MHFPAMLYLPYHERQTLLRLEEHQAGYYFGCQRYEGSQTQPHLKIHILFS